MTVPNNSPTELTLEICLKDFEILKDNFLRAIDKKVGNFSKVCKQLSLILIYYFVVMEKWEGDLWMRVINYRGWRIGVCK